MVKRISNDFNLEMLVFTEDGRIKKFSFFDLLIFRKCILKFSHNFLKKKLRCKKINGLGNLKVFIVFEGTSYTGNKEFYRNLSANSPKWCRNC